MCPWQILRAASGPASARVCPAGPCPPFRVPPLLISADSAAPRADSCAPYMSTSGAVLARVVGPPVVRVTWPGLRPVHGKGRRPTQPVGAAQGWQGRSGRWRRWAPKNGAPGWGAVIRNRQDAYWSQARLYTEARLRFSEGLSRCISSPFLKYKNK